MGSTCGLRGTDVTQVLGTTTHLRSTAVHDALAARLGPLCGAPCSLEWNVRDFRSSHSAGVTLVPREGPAPVSGAGPHLHRYKALHLLGADRRRPGLDALQRGCRAWGG